jgi:transcriptional regulator with XRE-family HTH domain
MERPSYAFGEKIREVRERKGRTMREVAEEAGVSESLISQIERNKVSPALDTLLAIVDVLGIDLEYLFAEFKRERGVNLVRKDERQRIQTPKALYERLSTTVGIDPAHGIEAFLLEIPFGGEKGNTEYGHVGQELGLVIAGKAEFTIGSKTYSLEEGDSISFASDSPHLLKNSGTRPLRAFWVVTPPRRGEL